MVRPEEFVRGFFKAFPDMNIEPTSILFSDNHIVFEVVMRETHDGSLVSPEGDLTPLVSSCVSQSRFIRDEELAQETENLYFSISCNFNKFSDSDRFFKICCILLIDESCKSLFFSFWAIASMRDRREDFWESEVHWPIWIRQKRRILKVHCQNRRH